MSQRVDQSRVDESQVDDATVRRCEGFLRYDRARPRRQVVLLTGSGPPACFRHVGGPSSAID